MYFVLACLACSFFVVPVDVSVPLFPEFYVLSDAYFNECGAPKGGWARYISSISSIPNDLERSGYYLLVLVLPSQTFPNFATMKTYVVVQSVLVLVLSHLISSCFHIWQHSHVQSIYI